MKGSKLSKGLIAALALTLTIGSIPVMATEQINDQMPEEMDTVSDVDEDFNDTEYLDDNWELTEFVNVEVPDEEDYDIQIFDEVVTLDDSTLTEPGPEDPGDTGDELEPGPAVTGVVLSSDEVTLNVVGQTKQLTVATTPDEDTIDKISWSSSNTSVAAVDTNGIVTALANGSSTITVSATYGGETYTDTCKVTVSLYNGFNKDPDSSDWYYYSNGQVSTETTDVINGTVNGTYGWWNVIKGKVTPGVTVAHNSNGWWYIDSNGKVDFDYEGFAKNNNGLWYLKDGKVSFDVNDVIKDTTGAIGTKGTWYYVVGSKVQTDYTGIADYRNSNGWWYIKNGQVDFTFNGISSNSNGSFYVEDGKVNFNYTGFAKNSDGSWYVEDGKVTFNTNSVIKDTTGAIGSKGTWYYVVGSKVQSDFTGLADYRNSNGWWYIKNGQVDFTANTVARNKNGWYYVEDGKVNMNYTGFAQNNNGWWYIEKGKVTFNKNSVIKGTVNGTNAWWYVVESKVQTGFTGLADYSNSNGWWYINNGKVTFDYTGFAQNKNGWYYIEDSKVNFSKNSVINGTVNGTYGWYYVVGGKVQTGYTGVANYRNSNGWWYIKNGQVDFTFNGIASNNNGRWVVNDGKVNFNYNGTYTYGGVTYNVTNGKASNSYESLGMSSSMYNKAQSQSSSTKWLIMVDVDNCKLGIFQGSYGNWTPYKCWDCTTGASGSPTCRGTYTIYGKGYSFGDDDHTCYYYNQFNGNYLIHSILYYPGTFNVKDGRLGMHLSNGCVRLSLDNAKWVYDNVPYSTRVVTY